MRSDWGACKNSISGCDIQSKFALAVSYRPIDSIKPNERNPRLHSAKQIRQISKSIAAFGFNVPLLIDREGRVVAGHGRLLAAQSLGMTEVPTISLEHLTPAQAKAFLIADNKLTENGAWDDTVLAAELKSLTETELDFTLDATGFELGEINLLIENLTPARKCDLDPADRLPARTGAAQISRPGDLWLLGRHRILCGNPLDQNCYATLLHSERAAMVIADSSSFDHPINVGFTSFMTELCALLLTYSIGGSVHFLFVNCSSISELATVGRQAYGDWKDVRVWVKAGAGTGLLRSEQFALVLVFRSGKSSNQAQADIEEGEQVGIKVGNYVETNVAPRARRKNRSQSPRGAAKTVATLEAVLKEGSKSGEIVLDPFLDSGTTLLAAERIGRVCRGMETDAARVDLSIRRWQDLTGKSAIHGVSGTSFTELEMEARREF